MAAGEVTKWICFLFILQSSSGQLLLSSLIGGGNDCESICENTYPLHTYEKAPHLGYCMRGCRLFSIIDFVNDCDNLNDTQESCAKACGEAYEASGDQDACIVGCNSQLPFAQRKHYQLALQEEQMNMQPFLYVHQLYSNMVDKVTDQMSVRWSFYMQSDNGKLVVLKSEQPHVIFTDFDDDGEYKTSNYIETNLALLDNSATPNLKNSQVNSQPLASLDVLESDGEAPDWLGCVSRKTGLPRLLLSLTLFLAAMVMIWLCVTAAATAPEQRVPKQKLSIYGDLDYLESIEKKSLLSLLHPQMRSEQASPLPVKINLQSQSI